jgi:hypothetical protein
VEYYERQAHDIGAAIDRLEAREKKLNESGGTLTKEEYSEHAKRIQRHQARKDAKEKFEKSCEKLVSTLKEQGPQR